MQGRSNMLDRPCAHTVCIGGNITGRFTAAYYVGGLD
eukprot:COSAG05_NODE_4468_length_1501_cov_141.564375_2_plen_36_part_01